jgi:hypothetical protein
MVSINRHCRAALGATASEAWRPRAPGAVLYVYEFEEDVAKLAPDFAAYKASAQCHRLCPRQ